MAGADFELRKDSFLAARETHIAGEGKLTSDTGWRVRESTRSTQTGARLKRNEHVQVVACNPVGPGRVGWLFPRPSQGNRNESEKEAFDLRCQRPPTLNLLVSFDLGDGFVELWNSVRAKRC